MSKSIAGFMILLLLTVPGLLITAAIPSLGLWWSPLVWLGIVGAAACCRIGLVLGTALSDGWQHGVRSAKRGPTGVAS